ncbi:hypothetical protein BJX68DRAFT_275805 [Aspergillus pseudodeflectus]|uniref:C2H2-type domain-containing protein n=1 Tax=Aspergillus pseudodeflectus TaxID=176178 RepID=A0ABR4KCD8_9EURO
MNGQHQHRPSSRDEFDIAIICALSLETNAVLCSLDEYWPDAQHQYGKVSGDANIYAFGRCGRHAVVVVTLPRMGKSHAASAASTLKVSFKNIKLALLVGICGAVPFKADRTEIILGDVIISEMLVEFDFGREHEDGFERRRDTMFEAPRPPEEVAGLLNQLRTPFILNQLQNGLAQHLEGLMRSPQIRTTYPVLSQDKLYESSYIHKHQFDCYGCSAQDALCKAAQDASCEQLGCDRNRLVPRSRLPMASASERPTHRVHFGSIGTADTVMRSAKRRDALARKEGIIAFEMEGAGVWTKFNCLIIKGVCDYADSHKNKDWQGYAAAVAASAAKEVLANYAPPDRPSPPETPDVRSNTSRRSSGSSRTLSDISPFYVVDEALPKTIFDEVLKDFEKRFEMDQVERFRATDVLALKRELARIQRAQQKNKKLRNLRRLESFIEKFEQFGRVLDDILEESVHMNFVWGPVKALLKIPRGHPELLDALLSAYEKIGDELPILGDKYTIFKYHLGLQRILARLFIDIMDFHQNALDLYSGRALKTIFKPLWQDFEPMFEGILNRMRAHKRLIEDKTRAMYTHQGQHELDAQEIRDHLRQLEKDALELKSQEEERKEARYSEVKDWIAGAETETKHNAICNDRNRYPGSGAWILDNDKVKDWLSPDSDQSVSSILWIHGRPGTGKTYLASVLIEECKKDEGAVTSYFYCDEAELKTSAIAVVRGILAQLVHQHRELVPYCRSKWKNSRIPTLTDLSVASTLLETFCERIPRLYMVVDGLDECENGRKDLLESFKNLINKSDRLSPGKLRVLFLSRPMPEIKNAVPEAAILPLGPEHNRADIKQYCRRRSRELQKFEFNDDALNEVLERICIQADGMFLFATLVMTNLARQPNRRTFYKEISAEYLPTELNQAYDRIMKRLQDGLNDNQWEYTRLLLGWLVCSKRPLKWREVEVAFSIDMNTSEIRTDLDMDLTLRDDAQELCGSLVQVLKGNRVELVHSTAKEFLRQSDINLGAAECDLTVRCLRYLTLDLFRSDTPDSELRRYAKRGDLALQDYAIPAWSLHIRTLVEREHEFLDGTVMSTDRNDTSPVHKITHELERFVYFYADSFPETDLNQPRTTDCEFFQHYPFYEHLVRIWDHICTAQRGDLESRNKVSITKLREALERNRALLETLSQDPTFKKYPSLYDEYPFRCPKLTCFYFQEGYRTAEQRDNHVNHHDMPFQCRVETCHKSIFGFKSNNELNTHMKRYHPEEVDLGESFTNLARPEVNPTRWECPECHKFFVRRNILEDHTRSHRGEKPFCCGECGRGFARRSDMKRHEKIHERRRG